MYLKLTERGRNGDYSVIEVTSASFRRLAEPCVTYRERGSQEEKRLVLRGNAFLLNDGGDTIESFFIENRQAGRIAS